MWLYRRARPKGGDQSAENIARVRDSVWGDSRSDKVIFAAVFQISVRVAAVSIPLVWIRERFSMAGLHESICRYLSDEIKPGTGQHVAS